MANEMPHSSSYTGLSRNVLAYGEAFLAIVDKIKQGGVSEGDWAAIEAFVDVDDFERVGVFLTAQAEVIGWPKYKSYVTQFGGATAWEGTLRNITESGNRVIQELEERNTRGGETDVSNTVTVFEFNDAGKLRHLDVYVMHLRKQPAA